ncbi:MAG: HIT domain-containing protein [Candidatus Niyogibacteria bacterium]|nr:HIT domain-containing protein [Candidatus Niyogibacteria bacterium]
MPVKNGNCVFCEISAGKTDTDMVFDGNGIVAFTDIHPSAPVHILIVPKRHIVSVKDLEDGDRELVGQMTLVARDIARQKSLQGYKLVFNVGREGGQIIDHLHLHLLGGAGIK